MLLATKWHSNFHWEIHWIVALMCLYSTIDVHKGKIIRYFNTTWSILQTVYDWYHFLNINWSYYSRKKRKNFIYIFKILIYSNNINFRNILNLLYIYCNFSCMQKDYDALCVYAWLLLSAVYKLTHIEYNITTIAALV